MSYLKKWKSLCFAIFVALLIPTSAFANTGSPVYGPGEWDTILISDYTVKTYPSETTTRTVLSGGGNLRVCMSGVNSGNEIIAELKSEDGLFDATVDYIHFSWFNSGSSPKLCSGSIDVSSYKDGDYAEFYLNMQGLYVSSDTVTVYIED